MDTSEISDHDQLFNSRNKSTWCSKNYLYILDILSVLLIFYFGGVMSELKIITTFEKVC